nr:transposase [Streptomyces sp. WM6378]
MSDHLDYTDRRKVAAALKPVYTAVDETAALAALETVRDEWGRQYPGTISVFENAWARFIPFLDFDQDIRRVIYTTDEIGNTRREFSLNRLARDGAAASARREPRRRVPAAR